MTLTATKTEVKTDTEPMELLREWVKVYEAAIDWMLRGKNRLGCHMVNQCQGETYQRTLDALEPAEKTIEAVPCPECGRAAVAWKRYFPDAWVVVCRRNKCHMSSDVGRIKHVTLYDAIEAWNAYVAEIKEAKQRKEQEGIPEAYPCPRCGRMPCRTHEITEHGHEYCVFCDTDGCSVNYCRQPSFATLEEAICHWNKMVKAYGRMIVEDYLNDPRNRPGYRQCSTCRHCGTCCAYCIGRANPIDICVKHFNTKQGG